MIISQVLIGSVGLRVGSGMPISGLAPAGIMCASNISILYSISTLIMNEFLPKLKIGYTMLRDMINVLTLLIEKIFKQRLIGTKIHFKKTL